MSQPHHKLGDCATSEDLIKELYLDLRTKIHLWSALTKQTAQARMGYVGQHLVSVVTGLPGAKSGARGADLIEIDSSKSEIKTCYRVDQLGHCLNCNAVAAPHEVECSHCGNRCIERKDDSKWLITVRNSAEFSDISTPKYYYFALFEFENIATSDTIVSSIYKVDPRHPGFSMCIADYYLNLKPNSASSAPFNLWPHDIKFLMMNPVLIYRSFINKDLSIQTELFPGRDESRNIFPCSLRSFVRSKTLSTDALSRLVKLAGFEDTLPQRKSELLDLVDSVFNKKNMDSFSRTVHLSQSVYCPLLESKLHDIQRPLLTHIEKWFVYKESFL